MQYELRSTETFNRWIAGIDSSTKRQLLSRLARVENGNFGDFKAVSGALFELRCFFGGGLRVYYTFRNGEIVLLLAGGNKTTQTRDIDKAKILLDNLEN